MAERIVAVNKSVIINKIFIPRIVRRIYVDKVYFSLMGFLKDKLQFSGQ